MRGGTPKEPDRFEIDYAIVISSRLCLNPLFLFREQSKMSVVHKVLRGKKPKPAHPTPATTPESAATAEHSPPADIASMRKETRDKEQQLKAGIQRMRQQIEDQKRRLSEREEMITARDSELARLRESAAKRERELNDQIQALTARLADAAADLKHQRAHTGEAPPAAPDTQTEGSLLARAKALG